MWGGSGPLLPFNIIRRKRGGIRSVSSTANNGRKCEVLRLEQMYPIRMHQVDIFANVFAQKSTSAFPRKLYSGFSICTYLYIFWYKCIKIVLIGIMFLFSLYFCFTLLGLGSFGAIVFVSKTVSVSHVSSKGVLKQFNANLIQIEYKFTTNSISI